MVQRITKINWIFLETKRVSGKNESKWQIKIPVKVYSPQSWPGCTSSRMTQVLWNEGHPRWPGLGLASTRNKKKPVIN
jgi:hypothetical protein